MSYTPTEWQDRIVEKPRTYHVQNNPDGTITLIPAPGTVVQEGTPVNAANLNKIEQGFVSHLAEEVSQGEVHGIAVVDRKMQFFDGLFYQAVESKYTFDTWSDVQDIVRHGLASECFEVGDQLVSVYDGDEIVWEVIGIDVDTPANSDYTHSMTIQTKDCLHDIQFDAKEPTNPNSDRQTYGNNRYIHSAVKQWLNSNESTFQWQSQHQYDATPTDSLGLYGGAGFLKRLDPELVAVLGAVNKKVARNTVTDSGGQDTFSDKVFLLSPVEVGFDTEGDTTGEIVYPYYNGVSNAGRIKLLDGSARFWWLRSPSVSSSSYVRHVNTSGAVYYSRAYSAGGLSPACVII